MLLRTNDFIESAVYELYSAVVLNRNSDASGFADHIPEVFSPGDSSGPTVVVGAMYSFYEPETSYVRVLPFAWVIKGHRIGMSGFKPADRSCTNPREHSSIFVGGFEKFIDAQTTPDAHHLQRVPTANIDDICRQQLPPDMLLRRLFFDEEEDVSSTLQELAKILLDALPIPFGIRTGSWDKKQLWILLF